MTKKKPEDIYELRDYLYKKIEKLEKEKKDYKKGLDELEKRYDDEIHAYRSEANCDIEDKDALEAKIRLLEEVLAMFGINTEFDFQNCY